MVASWNRRAYPSVAKPGEEPSNSGEGLGAKPGNGSKEWLPGGMVRMSDRRLREISRSPVAVSDRVRGRRGSLYRRTSGDTGRGGEETTRPGREKSEGS
jgi:hypothetical protein